jgi:hypothetical protein
LKRFRKSPNAIPGSGARDSGFYSESVVSLIFDIKDEAKETYQGLIRGADSVVVLA